MAEQQIVNSGALRALREARGWDQQRLAQEAGIDPSVVSRLERGLQDDFRVSVLLGLARALEVPLDSLVVAPAIAPLLAPTLTAAVARLGALTPAQQRQVAAVLEAYLTTLPE